MLVAREELRLVEEGWKLDTTRVRVNADLCRAFPHRSLTPSGVWERMILIRTLEIRLKRVRLPPRSLIRVGCAARPRKKVDYLWH